MNSRFKPDSATLSTGGAVRKNYCDKQFKKQLTKALINNHGEPDNIDKIRGNRYLEKYPPEKIIMYVNSLSADVQKHIETINDPDTNETTKLANLMDSICGEEKSQELPLVLKLKAESQFIPFSIDTHGVNFPALNQFLYAATSGLPDYVNLNNDSLKVLFDTYQMVKEQVDRDATPEFLNELKSKICTGFTHEPHPGVKDLAEVFKDKGLNPFNFPLEYLLDGSLPEKWATEECADPLSDAMSAESLKKESSTNIIIKSLPPPEKSPVKKKAAKKLK